MENFWNQFLNSLYYVHHRALNSCEPQILNFIWSLRNLRQFLDPLLNLLPQNTVALERHLDLSEKGKKNTMVNNTLKKKKSR